MYNINFGGLVIFGLIIGLVGGVVLWELLKYLWTHISIVWM